MSRPNRVPRITPDDPQGASRFAQFTSVVNTRSRRDIGLDALYVGDNVVLSDTKKVVRRQGFSLLQSGDVRSAFGVRDQLYAVVGNSLLHLAGATYADVRTVATGLSGTDYGWSEVNGDGYFVNGVDAGVVRGDVLLPWRVGAPAAPVASAVDEGRMPATVLNIGAGYARARFRIVATYGTADGRESAASDVTEVMASPMTRLINVVVPAAYAETNIYCTAADGSAFRLCGTIRGGDTASIDPSSEGGRKLTTMGLTPLPTGVTRCEFYAGRMYASEYVRDADMSVIWCSQPFAFHLFDPVTDHIVLPGELSLMLRCNQGMLLGTTEKIYLYGDDESLNELASYGVVPGAAGDLDATSVAYFWTQRGMCKAMPFENLTEKMISMPPGDRAVASIVYTGGMQLMLVATSGGGDPFNAHTERT